MPEYHIILVDVPFHYNEFCIRTQGLRPWILARDIYVLIQHFLYKNGRPQLIGNSVVIDHTEHGNFHFRAIKTLA